MIVISIALTMKNSAISAGSPMYFAMPSQAKNGASRPDAKVSSVLCQTARRACINASFLKLAES